MANKARITYRFEQPEPKRTSTNRPGQETGHVIPLMAEEYSVIEERVNESPVVRRENEEPSREQRTSISGGMFESRPPLNQFTTDFGSWSSPFDEETERVERMIRESGRATVQREQPERPNPESHLPVREVDTIIANGETGYYRGPDDHLGHMEGGGYAGNERLTVTSSVTRFERHTRTPWLRIAVSVTGAITTGVLIGFVVLNLFSGDDAKDKNPGGTLPASNNQANGSGGTSTSAGTNPGLASGSTTGAADPNGKANPVTSPAVSASASATVAVRLPARTFTLLQVGAFANQQGADAALAEFRKLGLAAASQASDKVYLYAGLTPGRDDALALSDKLKAQKTEVYIKTLTTPAVTAIKWNGKQPTVADTYFTQSSKLTASLTNLTTLHLKEAKPGPIEDNTLQAIHTAHQAWSGTASAMAEGMGDDSKAMLLKMNTALNTAVMSIDEYKKNPSASFLWEAQNGVLQYVLLENDLLRLIAAG